MEDLRTNADERRSELRKRETINFSSFLSLIFSLRKKLRHIMDANSKRINQKLEKLSERKNRPLRDNDGAKKKHLTT